MPRMKSAKKPLKIPTATKKKSPVKKKAIANQKAGVKVAKKKVASKNASSKKKAARKRQPVGDVFSGPIHGIEPYVVKRGEEYMSDGQIAHFKAILESWKSELINHVDDTVDHMRDEAANFPDPNDRATQESEFGLELRTRDRERKLLLKINSVISSISAILKIGRLTSGREYSQVCPPLFSALLSLSLSF